MNRPGNISDLNARIVLFGSEYGFSRLVLKQLLTNGLRVVAIVKTTLPHSSNQFPVPIQQPIKPEGFEEMARKNDVAVIKTEKLNDQKFIDQVKEKHIDIILVACFARKIPIEIWKHLNVPCWNLHPSLLPKYRGPYPLYWQIINNESETGLTLHEVNDRIDAGDIVARQSLDLPKIPDQESLDNWVSKYGVMLFQNSLHKFLCGDLRPKPQNENSASYFPNPKVRSNG